MEPGQCKLAGFFVKSQAVDVGAIHPLRSVNSGSNRPPPLDLLTSSDGFVFLVRFGRQDYTSLLANTSSFHCVRSVE
jgi:hypothetical protein